MPRRTLRPRCLRIPPLLLAPLALACGLQAAPTAFPGWESLSRGPLGTRPLPGQNGFVFTMYGGPGDLGGLEEMIAVMKADGLGNGLDPGPAPRPAAKPLFDYIAKAGWPVMCYPGCADMQIQGGRCRLTEVDAASLVSMDRAGAFTAVQLGEWGYYFHNLSPNENWWRDVYGADFPAMRRLMKPAGLAGYDAPPRSKRECCDVLHDYFASRSGDLLNRVISVTGHSHYEAYAAEWGAKCVGLEVGENIAFTQSKLAFARGAARQWSLPWSVQVSPWFSGACTTSGPLRREGGGARGLDAGHSLSFYERMWLHGWFAGAAMVTPENSSAIFFEQAAAPWRLTSHGRKAAEVFKFTQTHDRGVPFTPVAVVLDHLAGYNGYMDKPWGILPPTRGDRALRDLFDQQLFPGADHIHARPDPGNPEASYLRPTPYGEMFDVLLGPGSPRLFSLYPTLLLAGDIDFDAPLLAALEGALRGGSRVLLSEAHQTALGGRFERLRRLGRIEVLEPWTNPATGRPAAISNRRLEQLRRESLPVDVTGGNVEYQVNRTSQGWVVELINNRGVRKQPAEPAVVEPAAQVVAAVTPGVSWTSAREWRSGREHRPGAPMAVTIPAGGVEFLELKTP